MNAVPTPTAPRDGSFSVVCRILWAGLTTLAVSGAVARESTSAQPSADDTGLIREVECGFGGACKLGTWAPVRVMVDGGEDGFAGHVEVQTYDSDGVPVVYRQATSELQIAAGEEALTWAYFRLGRIGAGVIVRLVDRDGTVRGHEVARPTEVLATQQWMLVVGPDVDAAESALHLEEGETQSLVTTRLDDRAVLPPRWWAFEGVDTVLWVSSEAAALDRASPEAWSAFRRWVEMGGHLVVSAGSRGAELFEDGGRLHEWRPGDVEREVTRWRSTGVEAYVRASEPLRGGGSAMTVFKPWTSPVDCFEGIGGRDDRPFVLRRAVGFGQLVVLAVDLDAPPLDTWKGRSRLIARLVRGFEQESSSQAGGDQLGQVTHLGYEDIAGQLRGSLDRFPGVTRVRFSWIAGLIVAYVLLIGPIDYLASRKLGRPHLTWITFPIVMMGFCILAIVLSRQWRSEGFHVNHVELVDVDLAAGIERGTAWTQVYSPRSALMDLQSVWVGPGSSPHESMLAWQGLPGAGLGGMNTRARASDMDRAYTVLMEPGAEQGLTSRIEDLPVQVSATRSLVTRWIREREPVPSPLLSTGRTGLLQGRIVNPLDITLEGCSIYYRNWAYRLRTLAPGEPVVLDTQSPRDLKWQLTGRTVNEANEVSTPWNRSDLTDLERILEMVMFQRAAGGASYTGLYHRYQGFADLSDHLRLDRAILIGRSAEPSLALERDGERVAGYDRRWTYYRILIPVSPPEDFVSPVPEDLRGL